MAKKLPSQLQRKIKEAVFTQADAFGYAARNRTENSAFMDELISDPNIGGVLINYMEKEHIRTYIKDAILNAYTKKIVREAQAQHTPEVIVKKLYAVDATVIENKGKITICCCGNYLFVVSEGTVLKWETALRKALERIANLPDETLASKTIEICLKLAVTNSDISKGDKLLISKGLSRIGAKVYFCA